MQAAVDYLWTYTGEMFTMDSVDQEIFNLGIGPDFAALKNDWNELVNSTFEEATLQVPAEGWYQSGGKQGKHSEHLGFILSDMQFLQRAHPGAKW
jgi:ring-1,2-phenylacetyl-CoA epoxidase subunit PaaC